MIEQPNDYLTSRAAVGLKCWLGFVKEQEMRIICLRLLLGWWMIPMVFVIFPVLSWLLWGRLQIGVDDARVFSKTLWGKP